MNGAICKSKVFRRFCEGHRIPRRGMLAGLPDFQERETANPHTTKVVTPLVKKFILPRCGSWRSVQGTLNGQFANTFQNQLIDIDECRGGISGIRNGLINQEPLVALD